MGYIYSYLFGALFVFVLAVYMNRKQIITFDGQELFYMTLGSYFTLFIALTVCYFEELIELVDFFIKKPLAKLLWPFRYVRKRLLGYITAKDLHQGEKRC